MADVLERVHGPEPTAEPIEAAVAPVAEEPGHGRVVRGAAAAAASAGAAGTDPSGAGSILRLQRIAGNQAVLALLRRSPTGARPSSSLAAEVERAAGVSVADAQVHRASPLPGLLGARSVTHGAEVHLGPGAEGDLGHELRHVAQQRLGRVRADGSHLGLPSNRDPSLEAEADGAGPIEGGDLRVTPTPVLQGVLLPDRAPGTGALWTDDQTGAIYREDPAGPDRSGRLLLHILVPGPGAPPTQTIHLDTSSPAPSLPAGRPLGAASAAAGGVRVGKQRRARDEADAGGATAPTAPTAPSGLLDDAAAGSVSESSPVAGGGSSDQAGPSLAASSGEAPSRHGSKRGRATGPAAEGERPLKGGPMSEEAQRGEPPPMAFEPWIIRQLRERFEAEAAVDLPTDRSRRGVEEIDQRKFLAEYPKYVVDLQSVRVIYIEEPDDGSATEASPVRTDTHTVELHQDAVKHPTSPRDDPVPTEVGYRSDHFHYIVRIFGDTTWPAAGSPRPRLCRMFEVTHVTGVGGRSAVGRAYRRAQHYVIRPTVAPELAARIRARLGKYDYVREGAPPTEPGWLELPTPPEQTVRVWVRESELSRQPGQSVDPSANRRVDLAAAFPDVWRTHDQLLVTMERTVTPRKGRQGAGRDPASAFKDFGPASTAGVVVANRARSEGDLASHEFCHLIGDGDGGACDYLNLVVGTNPANTEQLAMEATFRRFRPRAEKAGYWVSLRVEMAASRIGIASAADDPDEGVRVGLAANYQIFLTPRGGSGPPIPVHRQLIDMTRGVIPAAEVAALEEQTKHRFEAVLLEVEKGPPLVPDGRVPTHAQKATNQPPAPG